MYTINSQYIGTPVNSISTITVNSVAVTINASRYYPRERHESILPLIAITPGSATYQYRYGHGESIDTTDTPSVQLFVFVHNFFAGSGPEDAQAIAEELIEQIKNTYIARPRLETEAGGNPLSVLTKEITFRQRTDFESDNQGNLVVTFTIDVPFETTIARII